MILLLTSLAFGGEIASWDFDSDDGDFVTSPSDAYWEWGSPSTGPSEAFSGSSLWGTSLDGLYGNDDDDWLQLPAVSLGDAVRPTLNFWHWHQIAPGDYGVVEVNDDNGGWTVLAPVYDYPDGVGFTGSSVGWEHVYFDLSGVQDSADVRLRFTANASIQATGWYVDDLQLWDGDIIPPLLEGLSELEDTEDLDGPYLIEVYASDDLGIQTAHILYSIDDEEEDQASLLDQGGELYAGSIPGPIAPGTEVQYRVTATDGANVSLFPTSGWYSFRVRLPAPTGLSGPQGRIVDTHASLSWIEPDSTNLVGGYVVRTSDGIVASSTGTSAVVPLQGDGTDIFTVRAVYDGIEGDPSEPLILDVALPQVVSLDPPSAWPGDTVRLQLEGEYLLLVDGDVEVDLGAGINLVDVSVLDVDRAQLTVEIGEAADVGLRQLVVRSGDVEVVLDEAFEVLDSAGRPALLAVEPDGLEQGESDVVRIELNVELDTVPLVDLGDDVIIEEVVIDGQSILVEIVVAPDAPIGLRSIEVDDGVRVLSDLEFRVRGRSTDVQTVCGSAQPLGPGLLLGLVAMLGVRRRRLS